MEPISLYKFGGSEEALLHMQRPFARFFRGCAPVLDIGCGRGVFLKLLSRAGITSIGIDHSEEAIAACRAKGLTVYHEDGQDYLSQNCGKFGGVFCSHVIEHMAYGDAIAFLQSCHGALRQGGVILLVTPNPRDISVISETFWLDPTHVRPYPTPLLRAMVESVGFAVTLERQFLGSWRLVGRRNLPIYWLRRMLLGRYYGKPNTLILARKIGNRSEPNPANESKL